MNLRAGGDLKHHLAWHSHFTDEKTESKRWSDLSKTMLLIRVNAGSGILVSTWGPMVFFPFSSLRRGKIYQREFWPKPISPHIFFIEPTSPIWREVMGYIHNGFSVVYHTQHSRVLNPQSKIAGDPLCGLQPRQPMDFIPHPLLWWVLQQNTA